jgi:hypothetical protein
LAALFVLIAIAAIGLPALNVAAPPAESKPVGPIGVRLPGGATVELAGVATEYSKQVKWWDASGAPTEIPSFQGKTSMQAQPGKKTRAFAIRIHGAGAAAAVVILGAGPSTSVNRPVGPISAGGMIEFPANDSSTLVTVGVAVDAWEEIATFDRDFRGPVDIDREMKDGQHYHLEVVSVEQLDKSEQHDGKFQVVFSHDPLLRPRALRAIAIIDDDKEITNDSTEGKLIPRGLQQTLRFSNDVELKNIKQFRVESRPYQWVEFRDVSLEPGHATRPTAVALDTKRD